MEATSKTSTLAIVSLVFGILGLVLLPLIGNLIAILTGHMARKEIRESYDQIQGDGLAVAGLVLGWVPIIAALIALIVSVFLFIGVLTGSIALVFVALFIVIAFTTFGLG